MTTEIIRLRGATQHNCRLCTSLRETGALEAGGSEPLYAEIAQYEESSELSAAHKAALRYVDALIWTPSSLDDAAAGGVLAHWSVDQAVEITLDVMRNATNKIAVALGGDEPRVADGVEHYRLGATGCRCSADDLHVAPHPALKVAKRSVGRCLSRDARLGGR